MSAQTDVKSAEVRAPEPSTSEDKQAKQAEARPPQAEEVLCTICGMRSCWK